MMWATTKEEKRQLKDHRDKRSRGLEAQKVGVNKYDPKFLFKGLRYETGEKNNLESYG